MDNLKTGDLLLCNYQGKCGWLKFLTDMIKSCTESNYSHIAMVLKDPEFIHPTLKGTYIWESSWEGTPDPQDGINKFGVQITPLSELLNAYKGNGHIVVRRVQCDSEFFSNINLKKVHDVVYNKPYDIVPIDWVEALTRKDPNPQKTNRFWCSALVGYIYTQCGLLDPKTDWSIMRPSDFSIMSQDLKLINDAKLSNCEEKLI